MINTALIGNPTDHSISDILFKEMYKLVDDTIYNHEKINILDDELKKKIDSFKNSSYSGLNVTLPHKMKIIKYLDEIQEEVAAIDAVNTIDIRDEKLIGYNTDWIGIYKPLAKLNVSGYRVCILGTGGASRAAIYAVKKLTEDITVIYREFKSINTINLINKYKNSNINFEDYKNIVNRINSSDIIINTTSAGMIGKDEAPFDLEIIRDLDLKDKIFFDAVFNPIETPLYKIFDERGAHCIDGLWMMIYQAQRALSIWIDKDIYVGETDFKALHELLVGRIEKCN
ncbi:shikimate dehydrogenase family protein [Macrococcus carouselicus]|uniref:shikimate dehydrogenase (NADP(+)) n=1 Tax=Macrococcus carouselicus TaxID=69969 RepID=A0A9Q8CK76_9STAP|nr:shikimate dehydrogenase [Macrococcus carouselicus]TDL95502.1 shikimate dehydrogenase [Macrococcus carouselicus]